MPRRFRRIGLVKTRALALAAMWISGIGNVDKQVLRDNWSGSGDASRRSPRRWPARHRQTLISCSRRRRGGRSAQRFERGTPDVAAKAGRKRRLPRLSLGGGKAGRGRS
ncbi:MAG: hypothetical protein IPO91_32935, partial [Chloroflexi bacterium]|nr:hypothetical protein [Chloroflexota bacterium]